MFKAYLAWREMGADRQLSASTLNDLRRYWLVDWKRVHSLGVNLLDRATVADHLTKLAREKGVYASNRARSALSGFYSWAIASGRATQNPVAGTKPFEETSRDRILTDAELRLIWEHRGDGDFADIVRLLILTGQRREEVGGMRWSEIDFKSAVWSIPGERTKNKRATDVPLPAQAIKILKGRPQSDERDFIFGRGKAGFQGWSRSLDALGKRIKKANGRSLPAWRPHDIRRTVATGLQKLGVRFEVTEAILNHKAGKSQSGVAAVYQRHDWAKEKREALKNWAAHVAMVVEGRSAGSNIVRHPASAA